MKDKLKDASLGILGCGAMIGLAALAVFLIRGVVWVSDKVLPWLNLASEILLGVCLLVLLPMCIFRKTRPFAGVGFYFGSYLFGLTLWVFSCLVCYLLWGYRALLFGLVLAGVGVLPVALVASVFTAHWSLLRDLTIQIVLTFGTRALGSWLMVHQPQSMPTDEESLAASAGSDESIFD